MDWQKEMNWEPLPPRKSRKKNQSMTPASSSSSHSAPLKAGVFESIEANIAERSKINRTQTTLDSRDGCAGEYYEYLDHTADVQCHAWGRDLAHAFENMAECMTNYMTDIDLIDIDPQETLKITVTGHDLQSLLYNYMNELLFKFITDCFVVRQAKITLFDEETFLVEAELYGDIFDAGKHTCGTEIKAITYSNMQIHIPEKEIEEEEQDSTSCTNNANTSVSANDTKKNQVDLFVIVDI